MVSKGLLNFPHLTPGHLIDVTRPSPFGNPYSHLAYGSFGVKVRTKEEAVERFTEYWYSEKQRWLRQKALLELPDGCVLGCVCVSGPCHAEIIAGYLNWKRDIEFNGPKARTVIWH